MLDSQTMILVPEILIFKENLAFVKGESEMRPSSWTVTIRSRKTEKNWEIIEYGTAKKTDIQCGIQV
jgi:primosomal protein N'